MGMIRIGLLQISIEDREPVAERIDRVISLVEELPDDIDVVLLPELWTVGAFNTHLFMGAAESLDGELSQRLAELARQKEIWLHAGSLPELHDSGVSNTSLLFDPTGMLRASYRKIHLFGFDDGEAAALVPGERVVSADTALGQTGLSTCYDLRFPEMYRLQGATGAMVFLIPSGWPAERIEHWRVLCRARAIENQAIVVGCNAVGVHAGVQLGGHSVVVAADGEVLAEAGPDSEETLIVELDLDAVSRMRESFPVLGNRRLG